MRGHFWLLLLSGELRNAIQHQASSELLDVANAISNDLWQSQNSSTVISEQTQKNMRNLVSILSATFNSKLQEVNELLHVQYWIMTIHKEKSNGAFTVANYLLDQVTNKTFVDRKKQANDIEMLTQYYTDKHGDEENNHSLRTIINAFANKGKGVFLKTKEYYLVPKDKADLNLEGIKLYQLWPMRLSA